MGLEELQFIEFLRRSGQKVTRARREVLAEVFRHHDHFDAEALYLRLKERTAGVSRATVYRTLSLLEKSKLVRKMEIGENRSFYEHTLGHPHHDHLICLRCGRIEEFSQPRIEDMQKEICDKRRFQMLSHALQIYGFCRDCQSSQAQQE
jgi:Fur family ferric uptake transcriptional regulator